VNVIGVRQTRLRGQTDTGEQAQREKDNEFHGQGLDVSHGRIFMREPDGLNQKRFPPLRLQPFLNEAKPVACNPQGIAAVYFQHLNQMKHKAKHLFVLAAAAVMVGFLSNNVAAQDAAERRQQRLDSYRTRIEVKSEEDWKKIEPLVGKVMDAQRETMAFAGLGGFPGGRGGRGGPGGGGGGGNGNRFGGTPVPEVEALQKAVEEKAPADEIKTKLAKVREVRKTKEAAVEKAQDDLRKALSPRQEAGAVLAGLLK
jgi:hypothetical protein